MLKIQHNYQNMETDIGVEKDDLAKAKHDLLMRFIKDQEELQTRPVGLKPSNNDATFDILDGLAVPNAKPNIFMKGGGILLNNKAHDLNEPSDANSQEDARQPIPRSQTCIPNFRLRKDDCPFVDLGEQNVHGRVERLKSGKNLHDRMNTVERPTTAGSLRRLRSAPSFSGRQSRNIIRSSDIDCKTRIVPSLSIVVPKEEKMEKLTKRRPSLNCSQVTRPRATVGISAVDVELFDKHTIPSLTGPYAMFHLPPIASETPQTPPST